MISGATDMDKSNAKYGASSWQVVVGGPESTTGTLPVRGTSRAASKRDAGTLWQITVPLIITELGASCTKHLQQVTRTAEVLAFPSRRL